MESSFWEVQCLRQHYTPQVSALATILEKDLTQRSKTSEFDIEPLLKASYTSMIGEELDRKLKKVSVAFYQQAPLGLFNAADSSQNLAGWQL